MMFGQAELVQVVRGFDTVLWYEPLRIRFVPELGSVQSCVMKGKAVSGLN